MPVVHVRHPAPMRYVPRGGSKERSAFLEIETPVELREIAPRELERVRRLQLADGAHELYAHGGGIWRQLMGDRAKRVQMQAITGDEFVGILQAGHACGRNQLGQTDYLDHFLGTPLLARGVQISRGIEVPDLPRARAVVDDGREEAARGLRRFLDANVRLCDGDVFVRWHGPLVAQARFWADSEVTHIKSPGVWRFFQTKTSMPVRVDRIDVLGELRGAVRSGRGGPEDGKLTLTADAFAVIDLSKRASFPEAGLGDEDLHFALNDLPAGLTDELAAVVRGARARGEAEAADALEARLSRLGALDVRGALGLIPMEEAEATFGFLEGLLADMARVQPPGEMRVQYSYQRRFLDDYVRPRLAEGMPLDAEDERTFALLGPR